MNNYCLFIITSFDEKFNDGAERIRFESESLGISCKIIIFSKTNNPLSACDISDKDFVYFLTNKISVIKRCLSFLLSQSPRNNSPVLSPYLCSSPASLARSCQTYPALPLSSDDTSPRPSERNICWASLIWYPRYRSLDGTSANCLVWKWRCCFSVPFCP